MSASEMVHSPFGSHLHTRGCCCSWDGLMKTSTSPVQKCCSHIPGGSSLHEATASFPLQKWPAAGDHRSQCSAHTLQTCGNVHTHTHTKTNTVNMFGQPTLVKTNVNQPALSIRSPVEHPHFEMGGHTCHTVLNQAELTGCRSMFPQRTSSMYIALHPHWKVHLWLVWIWFCVRIDESMEPTAQTKQTKTKNLRSSLQKPKNAQ